MSPPPLTQRAARPHVLGLTSKEGFTQLLVPSPAVTVVDDRSSCCWL